MTRSAATTLVGIVVLLAPATACGSSESDSAKTFAKQGLASIEAQAFAATKRLSAVHVVGHADSARARLALDLALDDRGSCVGSVTVNGDRVDVRRVHGTLYLRAGRATWSKVATLDPAQLDKLDGRWVTGLAAADVSVYTAFCDIAHLLGTYPTRPGADDRVTGTGVVRGEPVVLVAGRFGGATTPITISVRARPPHVITHLVSAGVDLTLSGFDRPVSVPEPAADDVVHVSRP